MFEDHLVALKVPNRARVRFEDQQQEFETVLRVSQSPHPNVLGCLFGWEDAANGLVPMVMPYAEGGSLKSRMEADPLPDFMTDPQRMTRAVLDMLDGMGHLHGLKLTHRDPAPRNVVITQDGRFMLCDFGLSRFMQRDADGQYGYGQQGDQGCAWAWMAPESFTSEFNVQSDMWSLGVIIWQMLTRCPQPYDDLTYDKVNYGVISGRLNLCQMERWPLPQGMSLPFCCLCEKLFFLFMWRVWSLRFLATQNMFDCVLFVRPSRSRMAAFGDACARSFVDSRLEAQSAATVDVCRSARVLAASHSYFATGTYCPFPSEHTLYGHTGSERCIGAFRERSTRIFGLSMDRR